MHRVQNQIPISPFDNALAIDQMEVAYSTLLNRPIVSKSAGKNTVLGKDGREHARIVSLGGDHTIVLPILRSLNKIYGQPISVIHFGLLFCLLFFKCHL